MGEQYYGAKASMNVWAPQVASQSEFSLSQIWVIAGSFGNDLNTIEAGWQVSNSYTTINIYLLFMTFPFFTFSFSFSFLFFSFCDEKLKF